MNDDKNFLNISIIVFFCIFIRFIFWLQLPVWKIKDYFMLDNWNYYFFQYDGYTYLYLLQNNITDIFHVKILKSFYIMFSWLNPIFALSIVPIIFTCLACIVFYFVCNEFFSKKITFLCALLLAINQQFMMNSYYGHIDTNSVNHFFIICIIYCFIRFLKHKDYSRYLYILYGLIFLYFFKNTWDGYFVTLAIIFLFELIYFIKQKKYKYAGTIFFICFYFFILKINYFLNYFHFTPHFKYLSETNYTNFGFLWPVVIILLYYSIKSILRYEAIEYKSFIHIWFIFFMISAISCYRFTFYVIMPGLIVLFFFLEDHGIFKNHWQICKIVVIILLFSSISFAVSKIHLPAVNDDIVDSMKWFKNNSDKNDIIISWWSYGALYRSLTNREVIYTSSPPSEYEKFAFSYSFLSDNITDMSFLFSKGDYLIVSSRILQESYYHEKISGLRLTNESNIYGLIDCSIECLPCVYHLTGKMINISIYSI